MQRRGVRVTGQNSRNGRECVCIELLDELLIHRALDSISDRKKLAEQLRVNIARQMGFLGSDEPDDALGRRLKECPGQRKALDAITWMTRPPGRPRRANGVPLQPWYIATGDDEPQPVKYLNLVRRWVAHVQRNGIREEAPFARHVAEAINLDAGLGAELSQDPEARRLLERAYREIIPDLDKRRSERALAVRALAQLAAVEPDSVEKAIYRARRDVKRTLDKLANGWDDPDEVIAPPAVPDAPRWHVRYEVLEATAPHCCRPRRRRSGRQEDYAAAERRRADELEADRRLRRELLERYREGTPKERMRNIVLAVRSMSRRRSGRTGL
jgi:hypothetical protein